MTQPTQEPTYWGILKSLLNGIQAFRACHNSDRTVLDLAAVKRQFVDKLCRTGAVKSTRDQLAQDLEDLVWHLQDDNRMWDWMTHHGGHYEYIRDNKIIETPREIYHAYCKRFGIPIPLPGQQQMQLF